MCIIAGDMSNYLVLSCYVCSPLMQNLENGPTAISHTGSLLWKVSAKDYSPERRTPVGESSITEKSC